MKKHLCLLLAVVMTATLFGGCAGQQNNLFAKPADQFNSFKPLTLPAFKACTLIKHQHVKRPVLPVVVHKPRNILAVYDIHIRRYVEGLDAF